MLGLLNKELHHLVTSGELKERSIVQLVRTTRSRLCAHICTHRRI
jgi:hypothetical protein